ncbi:MAG TPA: amidohydrolase [Saprospiraceae bacterium]|nr:amidohydrolase [Saprospiraceae bacterium]
MSNTTWAKVRQDLHRIAELSEHEYQTAKRIAKELRPFQPDLLIENLGGTGVAAVFEGDEAGKTLLFRAELDALPIQEINNFDHKSVTEGISHKCGHDGHMTTLLALAEKLHRENLPSKGRAVLLFQPAEENGEGAKAILADPKFEQIEPDEVFAWHNLPGYEMNSIILKKDNFNAAVKSIIIKLHGKTSHAGEPEKGINPAPALAEIITASLEYSNNDPERKDFTLVTPIHATMGEIAYGISAGYAELRLTIRTWSESEMAKLEQNILNTIERITNKYGIPVETSWTQEFSANFNTSDTLEKVRQSSEFLGLQTFHKKIPFKWGEDFGLFTQKYPGAMFGIGSGLKTPALHNPDYDFPDELIETGANILLEVIRSNQ